MGGAPARVDGRLGLLEGPQFPRDFDHERIAVFNTNTATVALDALDRAFDLRWLYVAKSVDGRTAVQLERLYHQISWELDTTFLAVPRVGAARPLLPDQGARGPRAGPPCAARDARRVRARLTRARTRHEAGTVAGTRCARTVGAWTCSGSRCRAAAPVASDPGASSATRASTPRPHRATRVRALRVPGRLAGSPVRGVLGPAPRVRSGARGARLRRACAADRVGLEGARATRPDAAARLRSSRRSWAARGRRAHVRFPAIGSAHESAATFPRCTTRAGARSPLAASGRPTPDARTPRRSDGRQGSLAPTAARTCAAPSRRRAGRRARVALVDDVYTTGATASACASALRRAGRSARRGRLPCAGSALG